MYVVIRVIFTTLRNCKTNYPVSGETGVTGFWPSIEKCNIKKAKAKLEEKRGIYYKNAK